MFELTRSFSQSDVPAACPHDGATATRLFSPPLDLLMYRREPIVDTRPLTIPSGALSCHDHGPPAQAAAADRVDHGRRSGSHWHAHGYEHVIRDDEQAGRQQGETDADDHRAGHGHGHGHGHSH
jgi:hypothetical protein